jgi:hypothetical protein
MRFQAVSLLCAAAIVGFVACSDDDETGDSTATASTSSATSTSSSSGTGATGGEPAGPGGGGQGVGGAGGSEGGAGGTGGEDPCPECIKCNDFIMNPGGACAPSDICPGPGADAFSALGVCICGTPEPDGCMEVCADGPCAGQPPGSPECQECRMTACAEEITVCQNN